MSPTAPNSWSSEAGAGAASTACIWVRWVQPSRSLHASLSSWFVAAI